MNLPAVRQVMNEGCVLCVGCVWGVCCVLFIGFNRKLSCICSLIFNPLQVSHSIFSAFPGHIRILHCANQDVLSGWEYLH